MNAPTRIKDRTLAVHVLCAAIADCEPSDAAQIMAAALQDMETKGPEFDTFGTLRQDARYWAEIAPVHEVQEYVLAGLKQLGKRAIGPQARKHMFAALWMHMPAQDKADFLRRIGVAE